jgi:hypothetical protein
MISRHGQGSGVSALALVVVAMCVVLSVSVSMTTTVSASKSKTTLKTMSKILNINQVPQSTGNGPQHVEGHGQAHVTGGQNGAPTWVLPLAPAGYGGQGVINPYSNVNPLNPMASEMQNQASGASSTQTPQSMMGPAAGNTG